MVKMDSIEYVIAQANSYFEASATFLIGSYARGDISDLSDVDILVVTSSQKSKHGFIRDLRCDFDKNLVSIIKYPSHILQKHWSEGSLFTYHLRNEARCYYAEGDVLNFMKTEFRLKDNFSEDIGAQRKTLSVYQPANLFDDSTVFFTSQLFLLLKNVAIFSLADRGIINLNKWSAYKALASRWNKEYGYSSYFEEIESAYLHIYKKTKLKKIFSIDEFKSLVAFTSEVSAYAQNS